MKGGDGLDLSVQFVIIRIAGEMYVLIRFSVIFHNAVQLSSQPEDIIGIFEQGKDRIGVILFGQVGQRIVLYPVRRELHLFHPRTIESQPHDARPIPINRRKFVITELTATLPVITQKGIFPIYVGQHIQPIGRTHPDISVEIIL